MMRLVSGKIKIICLSVLLIVISVLFNLLSIKNILIGVYKWHSVQPETIQGGIELLVFFLIGSTLLIYSSRFRTLWVFFFALILIYLQLHQVLLPATLSAVYLEVIVSIGLFLIKLFGSKISFTLETYIKAFIIGIITWSLFAIVCSALSFGDFSDLRILTICLWIVSLFKGWNLPFSLYVFKKVALLSNKNKVGIGFIVTLILTQFAKTNRALDYDSLWYGLRPEQVLIGNHSFFDNLGMVMVVHYYPKLFELFSVPLSNMGDYSFILSVDIIFYVLILVVIYLFCYELTGSTSVSILGMVLLGSTPAIANMASTAKTDLFSVFFIIVSAYYLWLWNKKRQLLPLILAISSAVMSLGGKITSLMYIPLLFFGFLLVFLVDKIKNKESKIIRDYSQKKISLYVIMSSLIVLFGICFRTYKLTGYPFYPILGGLWSRLGFKLKYPFSVSNDFILSDDKNLLHHWLKIFFDPEGYTHYIMVWPSNLYLFAWVLLIVLVVSFRKKINYDSYNLLLAFVPIFISGIYNISSFPEGGDGNYYIPVVIFTVLVFLTLVKSLPKDLRKIIIISMILFIPTQSCIMMVSHFSWSWGTSKFSLNLMKTNFESNDYKAELFRSQGLSEINDYLLSKPETKNCIGLLHSDGEEQTLNQLPCRFEDIQHINSRYGNSELFTSVESFKKYLMWANVKYIIVSKEEIEGFHQVKSVINGLEDSTNTKQIDAPKYYLLEIQGEDIQQVQGANDSFDTAKLIYGWYEKETNFRWISKEAEGVFRSGKKGELVLDGFVPDGLGPIDLFIQINDDEKKHWELSDGDFSLTFNNIPKNSDVTIKIGSNKSFIPKELGINEDSRELSVIIKDLVLN